MIINSYKLMSIFIYGIIITITKLRFTMKRILLKQALLCLCIALLAVSCKKQPTEKLYIFAAASTTDAVNEMIDVYTKSENKDATFATSYASSGALAKQIVEGGAEADIFISADEASMQLLEDNGRAVSGTKFEFGKNSIVIVASENAKGTIEKPEDIPAALGVSKFAMGDPKHVPAGRYGEAALTFYNVYDQLKNGGKLALYPDVRKTLNAVELSQTDFGIVYKTDAVKSEKAKIVFTFNPESHKPIVYPACAVSGKTNPETKSFLKFMQSKKGKEIIAKYGF